MSDAYSREASAASPAAGSQAPRRRAASAPIRASVLTRRSTAAISAAGLRRARTSSSSSADAASRSFTAATCLTLPGMPNGTQASSCCPFPPADSPDRIVAIAASPAARRGAMAAPARSAPPSSPTMHPTRANAAAVRARMPATSSRPQPGQRPVPPTSSWPQAGQDADASWSSAGASRSSEGCPSTSGAATPPPPRTRLARPLSCIVTWAPADGRRRSGRRPAVERSLDHHEGFGYWAECPAAGRDRRSRRIPGRAGAQVESALRPTAPAKRRRARSRRRPGRRPARGRPASGGRR